jgi:chorismate mutase
LFEKKMDLSDWRSEIDRIDEQVLDLLNRRAEIVREIGRVKAEKGLPVADEERERQILSRINSKANSALSARAAACIFQCIIEESRRIQLETIKNDTENGDLRRARLVCGRSGADVF